MLYFRGELSEKDFEKKLAEVFPGITIRKESYREQGYGSEPDADLFLFYFDGTVHFPPNGKTVHVGTWRKDIHQCWIFSEAFKHPELASFKVRSS